MPHNGLTWSQIKKRNREMAQRLETGTVTVEELAKEFNLSPSQVRKSIRKVRRPKRRVRATHGTLTAHGILDAIDNEIAALKTRIVDLQAARDLLKDLG